MWRLTHWIAGDIAYADTWLKEVQDGYINGSQTYALGYQAYEEILDDFYDQMTPITTQIPYMIGVGNHEAGHSGKWHRQPISDTIVVQLRQWKGSHPVSTRPD